MVLLEAMRIRLDEEERHLREMQGRHMDGAVRCSAKGGHTNCWFVFAAQLMRGGAVDAIMAQIENRIRTRAGTARAESCNRDGRPSG